MRSYDTSRGPGTGGDTPAPPALEDVYDDGTVRAIDAWRPRPPRPDGSPAPSGGRGYLAGAVVAAALGGTRLALEDDEGREPVVEFRPDAGRRPDLPVEVLFVPGDPAATVALLRPWLFPDGWTSPCALRTPR